MRRKILCLYAKDEAKASVPLKQKAASLTLQRVQNDLKLTFKTQNLFRVFYKKRLQLIFKKKLILLSPHYTKKTNNFYFYLLLFTNLINLLGNVK